MVRVEVYERFVVLFWEIEVETHFEGFGLDFVG